MNVNLSFPDGIYRNYAFQSTNLSTSLSPSTKSHVVIDGFENTLDCQPAELVLKGAYPHYRRSMCHKTMNVPISSAGCTFTRDNDFSNNICDSFTRGNSIPHTGQTFIDRHSCCAHQATASRTWPSCETGLKLLQLCLPSVPRRESWRLLKPGISWMLNSSHMILTSSNIRFTPGETSSKLVGPISAGTWSWGLCFRIGMRDSTQTWKECYFSSLRC